MLVPDIRNIIQEDKSSVPSFVDRYLMRLLIYVAKLNKFALQTTNMSQNKWWFLLKRTESKRFHKKRFFTKYHSSYLLSLRPVMIV